MKVSRGRINMTTAVHAAAVRGALALCALGLVAPQAFADSLQLSGHAGFLGEWELTASLTDSGSHGLREYSGPIALKHVGLCTHDGPEVKTGRMRLSFSASSSRLTATLLLAGIECTYAAKKAGAYDGVLSCPDQSPVPLTVELN
jgi:hypothetical protein